jgi:hypothetical protein
MPKLRINEKVWTLDKTRLGVIIGFKEPSVAMVQWGKLDRAEPVPLVHLQPVLESDDASGINPEGWVKDA